MTVLVNGERLERKVRRIYKNGDCYIGWTSVGGKDVKVCKAKFKKTWQLA